MRISPTDITLISKVESILYKKLVKKYEPGVGTPFNMVDCFRVAPNARLLQHPNILPL